VEKRKKGKSAKILKDLKAKIGKKTKSKTSKNKIAWTWAGKRVGTQMHLNAKIFALPFPR
jgi:hypothetical protein